ncbi:MAG TPA: zf-HC2 domain-containing protein [Ktedonobacterales bacterium]|jgi:hypothetical protein
MTCKQARQLLAAYRRDDLSPGENAALQAHLRECAECRVSVAEFRAIGETLRSLPKLAPPPDFYARVMAAVQAEEQQTAERAQAAPRKKPAKVVVPGMTDVFYLPALRRAVMERRARVAPMRRQMGPTGAFALRYGAALTALFLVLAFGLSIGLFQLLRSPGSIGTTSTTCIIHCSDSLPSFYSPDPAYPLVADATASADGRYIIYAAYNASGKWMLEELNRQTERSTALLSAPVAGPLTLEGWARSWVLWAQGDQSAGNHWELDATQLSPALPGAAQTLRLLQGNDADARPDGAVTTLHGVYALGATVLLAEELANGQGQLVSLDLTLEGTESRSVIATASQLGHLIADPTAVADPATGKITGYWDEQWHDPDGTLRGNIWRLAPGGVQEEVTTNGASFSPKIVAGKLIWLEAAPLPDAGTPADQPTPSPTAQATSTATAGNGNANNSQPTGVIWSENLDGRLDLDPTSKTAISKTNSTVSDLQTGATFVVWKISKDDYYLYDVSGNTPGGSHSLNSWITNPLAVSVSPTAVLWITNDSPSNSQSTVVKTAMNLLDETPK